VPLGSAGPNAQRMAVILRDGSFLREIESKSTKERRTLSKQSKWQTVNGTRVLSGYYDGLLNALGLPF
jgi:hypothetical protein